MTIAKKVPTTTNHQGANGGSESANNHAVSKALPSIRNGLIGRLRNLSIKASADKAVIDANISITKILGPNTHT